MLCFQAGAPSRPAELAHPLPSLSHTNLSQFSLCLSRAQEMGGEGGEGKAREGHAVTVSVGDTVTVVVPRRREDIGHDGVCQVVEKCPVVVDFL